ncbi:MAG: histone deacetylase family protein [Pseudomonadota bacterium]|nr:histone deacetylase family protein [Pseudomonadota bacterium]
MKAILAETEQSRHYPERYLVNGMMEPNPEGPQRIALLKAGAAKAGFAIERPKDYGLDPVARVHTAPYLKFLSRAYERWSRIEGAAPFVTPNIHPNRAGLGYPDSVVAQAGWHMLDIGAPIMAATWESALWSASSAVHAAEAALAGEPFAYALCRPPGHHANAEAAAGFCYLNNAAIAAEHLKQRFSRVAILDVDVHHGNGTQEIFYSRADVLTVSIHADPKRFYPFFWGHTDETGEGEGRGFNLNLPLPRGGDDAMFLAALETALSRIGRFSPDALVIALGLDASKDDPFAGLAVTTEGFAGIGAAIAAAAPVPTVIVQEGGYPSPSLGDNLAAFLSAYAQTRHG